MVAEMQKKSYCKAAVGVVRICVCREFCNILYQMQNIVYQQTLNESADVTHNIYVCFVGNNRRVSTK